MSDKNNNITSVQFGDKPPTPQQALITSQEVEWESLIIFGVDEDNKYRLAVGGSMTMAELNLHIDIMKKITLDMEID